jgi:hypothetical protein
LENSRRFIDEVLRMALLSEAMGGRRWYRAVVVGCAALLFAGCAASQLDFSLAGSDSPPSAPPRVRPVVVGVDNFVDLRPQTRGSDNKKWLAFIPGILWLDIDSDVPEIYTAFTPFDSRPMPMNVARSIAQDIRNSGRFESVVFLPEDPYQEVDYRLEGVLRRTFVHERGYYYGSSIYAWATRVLGLPYVSYTVVLEVDLRLRSMASQEVVWSGRIAGDRHDKYYNVYWVAHGREGKHLIAYNFSKILGKALPRILQGLTEAVDRG